MNICDIKFTSLIYSRSHTTSITNQNVHFCGKKKLLYVVAAINVEFAQILKF